MVVVADGLQNKVGLAFEKHRFLWGVENSARWLFRSDLGSDIHQDNPAEELNKFDITNTFLDGYYPNPNLKKHMKQDSITRLHCVSKK